MSRVSRAMSGSPACVETTLSTPARHCVRAFRRRPRAGRGGAGARAESIPESRDECAWRRRRRGGGGRVVHESALNRRRTRRGRPTRRRGRGRRRGPSKLVRRLTGVDGAGQRAPVPSGSMQLSEVGTSSGPPPLATLRRPAPRCRLDLSAGVEPGLAVARLVVAEADELGQRPALLLFVAEASAA